MNFKPLTTLDELTAAQAAGLRVEFSGNLRDSVNMPRSDEPNSGGWIDHSGRTDFPRCGQFRVEVREVPRYPADPIVRALVELLAVAVCPNAAQGCDGKGYPAGDPHGEYWQEQCQWCDERAALTATLESSP